MRFSEF